MVSQENVIPWGQFTEIPNIFTKIVEKLGKGFHDVASNVVLWKDIKYQRSENAFPARSSSIMRGTSSLGMRFCSVESLSLIVTVPSSRVS